MNHRADVGREIDIDRETGVGGTQINSPSIVDDPPSALGLRHVGEIEFHRHAPRSEDSGIDASADIPGKDRDIEVTLLQRVLRVAEPPFSEVLNNGRKRAAGWREMPFGPPRIGAAALGDADALQLLQSLG